MKSVVLVLDASFALAWLFERQDKKESKSAERALDSIKQMNARVPMLWHSEISNALLVAERRKVITEAITIDFINKLYSLPIMTDETVTPVNHRDSIMALAREYGLTAYDATYLDLALRFDGTLATFDMKLVEAMKKAGGKLWDRESKFN